MNKTREPQNVEVVEQPAVTRPPDTVSLPKLSSEKEKAQPNRGNLLDRLAESIRQMKPTTPVKPVAPVVHERPRQSFD